MPSLTLCPFPDLQSFASEHPAATASEWELNGEQRPEATLKGWDYGTNVTASRRIKVDVPSARAASRLSANSTLRVAVFWSTGAGFDSRELGFSSRVKLSGEDPRVVDVSFVIPGERLASTLALTTEIVLEARGTKSGQSSASEIGSRLWSDEVTIALEGSGPRLPVVLVELDPSDSAWSLQTSAEWLYSHPSAAIHVLVNRRREDICRALLSRPPDEKDRLVRSALKFDIGRQMIERALDDQDFDDDAAFGPQSSGEAIRRRLRIVFPGLSIEEVRAFRSTERERYERQLQASHQLFVTAQ
jgi:hypothetical protein